MSEHKCDFLPEVVEVLGAQERGWRRDDVILRIAQLKEYGAQFEQIASSLGVDLENQPPESVLERVQALLPPPRAASGLSFGQALEYLEAGQRVCREGWNGKEMFLSLTPGSTIPAEKFWSPHNRAHAEANGGSAEVLGSVSLKMADGKIMMGWTPNTADMLAEDWMVLPLAFGEIPLPPLR